MRRYGNQLSAEGEPCQRKKPCNGKYRYNHEIRLVPFAVVIYRCDSCGKKATRRLQ